MGTGHKPGRKGHRDRGRLKRYRQRNRLWPWKTGHGNEVHGEASIRTPEYEAWRTMRCLARKYDVTFCERWNEYAMFLQDMGRRPSRRYKLSRIDMANGYEPNNTMWAMREREMKFCGEDITLAELARQTGISKRTLTQRMARLERAMEGRPTD